MEINKLQQKISNSSSNMGELEDIILAALISYEDSEITGEQMKSYRHAANATYKVIKARFEMDQALITQFPDKK